jgi:hypothetical protein
VWKKSGDTKTNLLMFFIIWAAGFAMKDEFISRRFRRVAQFLIFEI